MRYYVESDGHLYLVRRGELWDLPTADEVPFPFDEVALLPTPDSVTFCIPRLPSHPGEWPSKDVVASDPGASELARAAVHATMPRVVVEGLCMNADRALLLVKGSRGYTAGRWSLPGGFLRFGERPEDGMARELREELGVPGDVGRLLLSTARLGERSRLHWVMLFYEFSIAAPPRIDPDEIAEYAWLTRAEIDALTMDAFLKSAIDTTWAALEQVHADR